MPIAVIDYCKGNLHNVERWLQAAGLDVVVTADPAVLATAEALVLPGVGAFHDASQTMVASGQMEVVRQRVLHDGVPFLGICLGLQLLLARGNEGCALGEWAPGIGAVEGECVRMADTDAQGRRYKVPHVGWDSVDTDGCLPSPLLEGVPSGSYFYFTHSYCATIRDGSLVSSTTTYARRFPTSLHAGNIYATQFHPEKSSDIGMRVAQNFGRIIYG